MIRIGSKRPLPIPPWKKEMSPAWRYIFIWGKTCLRGKNNFTLYPLSSLESPGTICSNFWEQLGKPRTLSTPSLFPSWPLPFPQMPPFGVSQALSSSFSCSIFWNLSWFPVEEYLLGNHIVNHLFSWGKGDLILCFGRICLLTQVGRAKIIPFAVFYTPYL